MARTHSSYTASPTRTRSPQRSPTRRSNSEDGSQYEMDLDALGLNSTFESTALEGSHVPPIDRVDTSEVEGPDDFTMNMTYWMTADLPPALVRSRKEAKGGRPVTNGERQSRVGEHGSGQTVVVEASTAASPTVRVNGTTASREYSTPASERSMENDEKVRSFLSALPDTPGTDVDYLPAGTPRHVPRQSMLHVPRSSPSKTRSMQATVEDHDTPRKPTQQTIIHHPSSTTHTERTAPNDALAELQSRFDQQELVSRTRITELETILSYTRSELDTARNDNYKHKDNIAGLERSLEEQRAKQDAVGASTEGRLEAQEAAYKFKLQGLEEELKQLNAQNAQSAQRAQSAQDAHDAQNVQNAQNIQRINDAHTEQRNQIEQNFVAEREELQAKLISVQARADSLQESLAQATAEAKAAREESLMQQANSTAAKATSDGHLSRIAHLETHLQDTRFTLECAQADVAAKAQLFQANLDLNASLRALRNELVTQQNDLADQKSRSSSHSTSESQLQLELSARDKAVAQHVAERDEMERQFSTAQGRISSLETSLTTLRALLADAHRESGSARADVERLSHNLEDVNDRLIDARAEADRRVADVEKKLTKMKELKTDAENKFRELKSQHDDLVEGHAAMLEDVRDKAEDAVRKMGALLAQEKKEKARLKKDMERVQSEMAELRAETEQGAAEDSVFDDTNTTFPPAAQVDDTKDKEIESLRTIIKNQIAEMKTLKSSHAASLKETKSAHEAILTTLRSEISTLQQHLEAQARDHDAMNAAMDEQLSHLLSKLMKERARTVVGKRDGQWEEVQKSAVSEKKLLGKVLLRQWGREECGVAEEKKGQRQSFEYKYVKRER